MDCNFSLTTLILFISTHLNLSLLLQVLEPFIYYLFFKNQLFGIFFNNLGKTFLLPPSSSSKINQISEVFLC